MPEVKLILHLEIYGLPDILFNYILCSDMWVKVVP